MKNYEKLKQLNSKIKYGTADRPAIRQAFYEIAPNDYPSMIKAFLSNQTLEEEWQLMNGVAFHICLVGSAMMRGDSRPVINGVSIDWPQFTQYHFRFQEFVYFAQGPEKLIPFPLWADIVRECFKIISDLVDTENFDYESHPQFPAFKAKVYGRVTKISRSTNWNGPALWKFYMTCRNWRGPEWLRRCIAKIF